MRKLKRYRKETGLSQADVGQILEVDQAAVSRWETGKTTPVRKYREKLARLFEVPVEDILKEDGDNLDAS